MSVHWYHITNGSDQGLDKVFKTLRSTHRPVVRTATNNIWVACGDSHLNWLDAFCKDYGCSYQQEALPESVTVRTPKQEEYRAPCGYGPIYIPTEVAVHVKYCDKCRSLEEHVRNKRKAPRVEGRTPTSPVTIVGKLAPHQNLTLDGVVSSLQLAHDQLFEELGQVSNLLDSLKKIQVTLVDARTLMEEAQSRRKTVRLILDEVSKEVL